MIKVIAGVPVDNGANDEGDSARAWGLLQMVQYTAEPLCPPERFMAQWGWARRSPGQKPWDNRWNFTRDQLKCLVAGFVALGRHDLVRQLFWQHLLRLFFCQNFQRDYEGSWKFPWPHWFTNDRGEREFRAFDFADPLFLDDIWILIRGGRMWYFYFFGLIGIPLFWLRLGIMARSSKADVELNQLFADCFVAGRWAMKKFKEIPDWEISFRKYWCGWRLQCELAEKLIMLAKRERQWNTL
jgi:hypothetical protein